MYIIFFFEKRTSNYFCLLTNTVGFSMTITQRTKSKWNKDNKNGTSLFAELKLIYANLVWITKNNVKTNIWKLYMIFEANKEFVENLSLQRSSSGAKVRPRFRSGVWSSLLVLHMGTTELVYPRPPRSSTCRGKLRIGFSIKGIIW